MFSLNVIKRGLASASKRSRISGVKVDRNIPQFARQKAWEKAGEDKESWFKRKYAHVHASQKQQEKRDPFGKRAAYEKRLEDDKRQMKRDRADHTQKYEKRSATQGLRANPLMEYVYGTNGVLAALQGDKREYFSRLLHHGPLDSQLLYLAKKRDVQMIETDKHRLNLITNYAVHNNVALETKPLQPVEISHLKSCDPETAAVQFDEILFENDRTSLELKYGIRENKKFPLGVYLDEVMDPHNIGAIIRSAYFLGADFVVMSRKNCAPLSPTVSKTSSGAVELLPIFHVEKPLSFFTKSQEEGGWTFITSSLTDFNSKDKKYMSGKLLALNDMNGLCEKTPVILVVGNEGNGVRTNLRMRSDFFVEIPFCREGERGPVDSLNVSVATALLINAVINA
ncbi:MRM1 (YOR201C) [Zygosaccharomyces parabailii]|nr:MRM1 (YOR201C) [Zygosaccharomyces parabailii]CDH17042.1 related to rRNA methyltransferase, mitochondrial [Zygosaccharomyces bailii ISA1307]SJM88301.1 related to rRNA methyltransferase, mitochondrial [Zygosaccharomyces bailii]